jgi:signal transduction histidine kinase
MRMKVDSSADSARLYRSLQLDMKSNIITKVKNVLLPLRTSLRWRVALGVALPVFIAMISLSILHYWRGYQLAQEQARLDAIRLSDMLISSLNHAMVNKEGEHLEATLEDIGQLEQIEEIQIVGLSGKVLADSDVQIVDTFLSKDDPECWACHQHPPQDRPRIIEIRGIKNTLRISAPISNQPECYQCHTESDQHLGVLLIDLSLAGEQKYLIQGLQIDLAITIGITLLISLGIYWLINHLVVKRIEALRRPLAEYTAGNLSARITHTSQVIDELVELGNTFNRMADEIDAYTWEQDERNQIRERAIIEERERIARDLHDGMAQVLGYVNTKAMAVRLMLQNGKIQAAEEQLCQLEEAARGLFVDLREAISGLKMAGDVGSSLAFALKAYVEQFTRMSDIPVVLDLQPEIQELNLTAEAELQLLRIVQEALTNVRKHAHASQVWLKLSIDQTVLNILIRDDGQGFDRDSLSDDHRDHYGLDTMSERAKTIGASVELNSELGKGTQVLVKFNLDGKY